MGLTSNMLTLLMQRHQQNRQTPSRLFGAADRRENLLIVGGDGSYSAERNTLGLFRSKFGVAQDGGLPAVCAFLDGSTIADQLEDECMSRGMAIFGVTDSYDPFLSCMDITEAQELSEYIISSYVTLKKGSISDTAKLQELMSFLLELLDYLGGEENITLENITGTADYMFSCDGILSFIDGVENETGCRLPDSFSQQLSRSWDDTSLFKSFINELERCIGQLTVNGAARHGLTEMISHGRGSTLRLGLTYSGLTAAVIFSELALACRSGYSAILAFADIPVTKRDISVLLDGERQFCWGLYFSTLTRIEQLPELSAVIDHAVCLGCRSMDDANKLTELFTGTYTGMMAHIGFGGGFGAPAAAGMGAVPNVPQLHASRLLTRSISGGAAAVMGSDGVTFYNKLFT